MPSSMIFVGLVVMWLLILVPAVARRRQEVARPSVTALSGRVLERTPRRDSDANRDQPAGRDVEVDVRQELEPAVAKRTEPGSRTRLPAPRGEARGPGGGARAPGGDLDGLDGWTWHDPETHPDSHPETDADPEVGSAGRPAPGRAPGGPPRYRPGRGGYDPQAAALSAQARYTFRQRVVLLLLVVAVGSAVAAVFVTPLLWWSHGGVDLMLVGYLFYLRRQVKVEEAIRRRRSARIGPPRQAPDIERLTDTPRARGTDRGRRPDPAPARRAPAEPSADDSAAATDDDAPAEPGEASGPRPSRSTAAAPAAEPAKPAEPVDGPPALPRLQPTPTPPVPIGTTLVEGEEDDPALHELESVSRPDYRRASGQ